MSKILDTSIGLFRGSLERCNLCFATASLVMATSDDAITLPDAWREKSAFIYSHSKKRAVMKSVFGEVQEVPVFESRDAIVYQPSVLKGSVIYIPFGIVTDARSLAVKVETLAARYPSIYLLGSHGVTSVMSKHHAHASPLGYYEKGRGWMYFVSSGFTAGLTVTPSRSDSCHRWQSLVELKSTSDESLIRLFVFSQLSRMVLERSGNLMSSPVQLYLDDEALESSYLLLILRKSLTDKVRVTLILPESIKPQWKRLAQHLGWSVSTLQESGKHLDCLNVSDLKAMLILPDNNVQKADLEHFANSYGLVPRGLI